MVTKVKPDINLDDVHPEVHPQLCVIMGIKRMVHWWMLVQSGSPNVQYYHPLNKCFCWISLEKFIWHLGEFFKNKTRNDVKY
jgi:hypothetical protein